VLPARHAINGSLLGANVLAMAGFLTAPAVPAIAAGYLAVNTVLSCIKGYTLTAAVGGADMRACSTSFVSTLLMPFVAVVITVLNAYSGFALVAEGTSKRCVVF
jgi:NAD(P) transhydrogenase